jgi:putative resolvase
VVVANRTKGIDVHYRRSQEFNGRRLSDPSAMVAVVEYRVGWPASRWSTLRRRSADSLSPKGETSDDVVRDMIVVVTPICARLFGRGDAQNRVVRALTATKQTGPVGVVG